LICDILTDVVEFVTFVVARFEVLLFVYVHANEKWILTNDIWHTYHRNELISIICHLFQIVGSLQEDPQVCRCDFLLQHSAVEVYKSQCASSVEQDDSSRSRAV
jgi:hypothetical protein